MNSSAKFVAVIAAFFSAGFSAQAQSISAGIKAGVSIASQTMEIKSSEEGTPTPTVNSKTGFAGGAFLNVGLGPIAIQPELLYVMKGSHSEFSFNGSIFGVPFSSRSESDLTLHYIDVPVLVKYQLPLPIIKPNLFAGPYVGFLAGSKNVTKSTSSAGGNTVTEDSTATNLKEVASSDFGLTFGAGVDFSFVATTVTVDVRYNLGLMNIYKKQDGDDFDQTVKNKGIMIMVGVGL